VREVARFRYSQRRGVRCLACGKPRNDWAFLSIECDFDGRAVYFHDRNGCREAARRWWDEHVRPLVGQGLLVGQWIGNLVRYVAVREAPRVVKEGDKDDA